MALIIVLCLLSCLIGLYRLQTSEFKSLENQSTALKADAKHVARFLILALPFLFYCLYFSVFTTTGIFNSRTKKCHRDE